MTQGLLPTELTCFCIYSLTSTPHLDKPPPRHFRSHSPWYGIRRDGYRLHVPRPRRLRTPGRSVNGEDNPTLCDCETGSRLLTRSQEPLTSGRPRAGKLKPSRPQHTAIHRRYQSARPVTSKIHTTSHRKLRVRHKNTTSPDRNPTTPS